LSSEAVNFLSFFKFTAESLAEWSFYDFFAAYFPFFCQFSPVFSDFFSRILILGGCFFIRFVKTLVLGDNYVTFYFYYYPKGIDVGEVALCLAIGVF
jgi:hypothetical protein